MNNLTNIKNENERKVLEIYLNKEGIFREKRLKSSYLASLNHARELTGRNVITGIIEKDEKTGSWAGACMYLILIDHIGGIFRNKNKSIDNSNIKDFSACLKSFTDLNTKDISILRELRNAFLHKFNLFSFSDNPKKPSRLFSVNNGNILIEYPKKEIYCSLDKINSDNQDEYTTFVSLKKIGDLVESIHDTLLNLLKNNELSLVLKYNNNLEEFLGFNFISY